MLDEVERRLDEGQNPLASVSLPIHIPSMSFARRHSEKDPVRETAAWRLYQGPLNRGRRLLKR